jgi:hypothetical protein
MSENISYKNKILCLSALGERFLTKNNNQKFIMLPTNTKNVYLTFSPLNKPLTKEYAKFIEIAIKYKLKDDLIELINKIKHSGSIKMYRMDILEFQHKLYIEVALQMLIHYYKVYHKYKVNIPFESFVKSRCTNNMKICQYIDKIVFSSNRVNLWRENLKKNFDKNKQEISEKMDIQLFLFKNGMIMPKWELDLNTSWDNTNSTRHIQGGLYDIDINPIDLLLPNNFENNQNNLNELLKNLKTKEEQNTIDTEFLDDSFSNWYNNNFRDSILPKKDIMEQVILQKMNNKHYLIDRNSIKTTSKDVIEMIENNDSNMNKENNSSLTINGNIILCFFYSDKHKNKKLTPHEIKIYNEQGIVLDLNNNNQAKQDDDKNWIINNNVSLNNQLLELHNETLSKLKELTNNQPPIVQQADPEPIINQPDPDPKPISGQKVDYYNNLLNKINNIEKTTELDKLADSLNKGRVSPNQISIDDNQLKNIELGTETFPTPIKQISEEKFNDIVNNIENKDQNKLSFENPVVIKPSAIEPPLMEQPIMEKPIVQEKVSKDISDGEILKQLMENIQTSEDEDKIEIPTSNDSLKLDLDKVRLAISEKEALSKYLKYKKKYLTLKNIN